MSICWVHRANICTIQYRPNRRVIDEFTFPCILAYLPDYHSITAYRMYYVGPSVCCTLFARHYAVVWYTYWQWHYWHIVRSRVYETVGCPSVRLYVASFFRPPLVSCWRTLNVVRSLHCRHSAAIAGKATLSADVGSWTQARLVKQSNRVLPLLSRPIHHGVKFMLPPVDSLWIYAFSRHLLIVIVWRNALNRK